MPIIWRFLLNQYFKVLALAAGAIVAVLMVTRLDEVAEFAILGGESKTVLLYTAYQLPYIFPIALPIACVLSSMVLFQRLSSTHEITALRTAGLPFRAILAPIVIASLFLGLFDFWIISDFTTSCRLKARQMELELRTANPIGLLQHRRLLKFTDAFGDIMGEFNGEDSATDVLLAMHNKKNGRTDLITVKALTGTPEAVEAQHTAIIRSTPSANPDLFDHLMVENIEHSRTPASILSREMRKEGWKLSRDHLNTALLLVRIQQEASELAEAKAQGLSSPTIKLLRKRLHNAYSELARRSSLAFSVVSLTLLGAAYGMSISRTPSRRNVLIVTGLVAFFLVCFFIGRSKDERFFLATTLYTIPHLLILFNAGGALLRVSRGIECVS